MVTSYSKTPKPENILELVNFGRLFSLLKYPPWRDAKEYAIPETVEIVAPLAFAGNPTLEKVVCPSALKVVAQGAFKDCPALWSVSLPGDVEIAPDAFEGTRVRN